MPRLAVTATLAVAAVSVVTPATAASATTGFAAIRAAHFSPTTPGMDVYLGSFSGAKSTEWLSGLAYGAVSPYQRLRAGLYTVSMRLHGAAANSPAALTWTLDARAGKDYTVAGVGSGASTRGVVIPDDLSTPPSGQGRVRVIQAASRAPSLNVTVNMSTAIVDGARFATTSPYRSVKAGKWQLAAASSTNADVAAKSTVSVKAGAIESVLVLDAKNSGITVRTVLDSSSSGAMPTGAVETGGGGTATRFVGGGSSSRLRWETTGGIAMMVLLGGSVLSRRRRYSSRHQSTTA